MSAPVRPEPGETLGLVLAGTFFVVLCAAMVAAGTGTIDDLFLFVLGGELVDTLLTGAAVAAVVGLLGWGVIRGVGHVGAHGHVHHVADGSDRGRAALQRHEDAHQKVGAGEGAGGSTVRIWPENGGWSGTTTWHNPAKVAALPPKSQIAIKVAGIMAAPSTDSPTDMPHAKAIARTTPNPGKAMREGRRIARRYI